ncbi:putative short chain type dehydrogenase [Flagelloscypha sp. PMI_526]|nr:putative short chain type dehydrogenase [Flagelloscypha sp. PMI_526]
MSTVLIIGAGPNIGLAAAKRFASAGYKVAIASRTAPENSEHRHFVFDAAKAATVPKLFSDVTTAIGAPKVVIYNLSGGKPADIKDPLSLSLDDYQFSMSVNTTSTFLAAQESVKSWAQNGIKGTFIFTGNIMNVKYIPALPGALIFGMGKTASASLIQGASQAYKEKGYKFYYVDERKEDGAPAYAAINGEAHAEHFIKLADDSEQGPWLQTFVKGKGYTQFNELHGQ